MRSCKFFLNVFLMVNEWAQEPNMTELTVCCVFILKSCATPYTFKALPKCWGTHTQKHTTLISLLVSETSQTGFSFTSCWIIQTCATTVSHDLTDKGQAQLYKRFNFFSFFFSVFKERQRLCETKNREKQPLKMLTDQKASRKRQVGKPGWFRSHISDLSVTSMCVCE